MERFKLEGLSVKQLEMLELAVRQRREYLIYEDRKRVRNLVMEIARQHGLSIYTLFDLPAPGSTRSSSDAMQPKARR